MAGRSASQYDYTTWSEFRYQIRRFLRTAEATAREAGLEPQQHQLLLAICGFPGGKKPTIGDLAERLQLRHHSTVELIDRTEQRGLVLRRPTGQGRAVSVNLTPAGRRSLDAVSHQLRPHLNEAGIQLIDALRRLIPDEQNARETVQDIEQPVSARRRAGKR